MSVVNNKIPKDKKAWQGRFHFPAKCVNELNTDYACLKQKILHHNLYSVQKR